MSTHKPNFPTITGLAAGQHTEPGTPAQQAFRQAVQDVENLRERLWELETAQAEARRTYWRQVGPLAQAVVAARRGLFGPLEEALLLDYFSRGEERQIKELIVANAESLRQRFGEDVSEVLRRYAPATPPVPDSAAETDQPTAPATEPPRRPKKPSSKAQRAAEAAAREATEAQQTLQGNTKALYRQLARANHPDLERDPTLAEEKTTRMQRITEAYERQDLYTLLQLMAEHGPDSSPTDDSLLLRYTQALQQERDTLKQRMNELKYGAGSDLPASGKKQEAELRLVKRQLRAEADYVQQVAQLMQTPEGLRTVLRESLL